MIKFKLVGKNKIDKINTCKLIIINGKKIIGDVSYENEKKIFSILKNNIIDKNKKKMLFVNFNKKKYEFYYFLILYTKKFNFILDYEYEEIIRNFFSEIKNKNFSEIIFNILKIKVKRKNTFWKIKRAIEIINDENYEFNYFKKSKKNLTKRISFMVEYKNINYLNKSKFYGIYVSYGIEKAKNLANMPSNICNSKYIKKKLLNLKKKSKKLKIEFIDYKKMLLNKMNAYLSVNSGSSNPPIMSVIKYYGCNKNLKPIIIIGKGVTFDSGGLSLKNQTNMIDMKYDMSGAASIYGIIKSLIKLSLPINVIGIIACAENSIDGKSSRPGDVVKSMSGKTIEIVNTDAEGRLILCDVLTYVEKFNPKFVINIATLTGSCIFALGKYFTGLMSNCNLLSKKLIDASIQSSDYIWRLPIRRNMIKSLYSNIADISNVSSNNEAGAIIAGCFLSCFAKKYKWAHLDIAGTANLKINNKTYSSGRPVSLMIQFLINISNERNK
ncbi:MAG: leucyl aminopeptidase [Enterobacteriaceae bacterium]